MNTSEAIDTIAQKTNNIYFPLCFLAYVSDRKNNPLPDLETTAHKIISYGIIEYAKKLQREDFFISEYGKKVIAEYVRRNKLYLKQSVFNKYIVVSAIKLNLDIPGIETLKDQHRELAKYLDFYECQHGKDVNVKMHKHILFELMEKKFDERMFRVYCAILSVIGNKPFVRITIKRISYRMHGYKTEDIYLGSNPTCKVLTARQIKTTIDKLQERNFFDVITYGNRQTFYSTKYRHERLFDVLTKSISAKKDSKMKSKTRSKMLKLRVNALASEKEKLYIDELLSIGKKCR